MKILLLPNAFKGTLSAVQAARILEKSLSARHTVKSYPISDGGDGFMDFFRALYPQAKSVRVWARDAFLTRRPTSFLLLPDGQTAVVETARICGLGGVPKEALNPMGASSYGVGEVILKAVKKGAKTIYVGLGGVACNDGGAGMAAACGARILDAAGRELPPGAEPLLRAKQIDLSSLKKQLKSVRIYAVADVTNPLLGPKSSAKVFGPQKGATPAQVKKLDKAMARWAQAVAAASGRDIARTPSTAAAGAIAAGLYGCIGAQLLLGADFLFQKAHLERYFDWADLVITTEGKLDRQTFYGKAPLAVLKLAQKHQKPVLFICGTLEERALKNQKNLPQQVAVLLDFAPSQTACLAHTARYLRQVVKNI